MAETSPKVWRFVANFVQEWGFSARHYLDLLPCASRVRAIVTSGRPDLVRSASVREEARHHVTDVILPAEEHREDPNRSSRLVDVEPVDCPSVSGCVKARINGE